MKEKTENVKVENFESTFQKWDELNTQLFQDCKDYIKEILLAVPYNEIDLSECNVCVTYDGGRHPEYDANPYSHVERVYCENNKIYLETEDCVGYDIYNLSASEVYAVADNVKSVFEQEYESED